MITFFRNFRHLKTAYILNIVGLSVAFAAFIIIMAQVRHEFAFDKHTPDSDRIYRVEIVCVEDMGGMGNMGDIVPIFTRLWADEIITSSPLVECGTVSFPFQAGTYCTIEVPAPEGSPEHTVAKGFREDFISTSPDFVKVFHFDIIEGSIECYQHPDNIMISESIAKKLFPGESPIGKQITVEESLYDNTNILLTIGAVYKDFKNTQLKNGIYLPLEGKFDSQGFFSRFNYFLYVKLTDSKEETKQAFLENYYQNFLCKHEILTNVELRLNRFPDIYFTQDAKYDGYMNHGKLSTTLILLSIGILIILLAAINFTNFSMALVPFRIKAVNTKKVLGSSDRELRRGLITDAVWTTVISALLSFAVVAGIANTSLADVANTSIRLNDNWDIAAGTVILSILIGILAGIYPARYTTSYSPALVLKGSFGLSPKGLRLRKILVAIQFIISLSLISCSILIQRQNKLMQSGDLGFNSKNLLISSMNSSFRGEKRDEAERRIKELPYVTDVAFGLDLICSQDNFQRWNFNTEGKDRPISAIVVSWNFAKTLQIPLIDGEYPTESLVAAKKIYVMPNKLAKEAFEWDLSTNINPEGSDYFQLQSFTDDVKIFSLKVNPDPAALIFYDAGFKYIYIRTVEGADVHRAITDIETILRDGDPSFPFSLIPFEETLTQRFKDDIAFESAIKAFSILAIIISIIGVFGLILFDTQQKRRDIAVRRIHGAKERDILLMFCKPYMILLGICWAISIPIVIYIGRVWLSNFANRVNISAWIFLISLGITLAITLVTIVSQVLRAVRNNPVESIRIE